MERTAGLQDLVDGLVDLGFKKRTGLIFTIDLAPDFIGWVGLNTAVKRQQEGHIEVHPNVGIRHNPTESLIVKLSGPKKRMAFVTPTLASPLYLLMDPQRYTSWVIGPEGAKAEAADLAARVNQEALPWMRGLATLPRLCEALDIAADVPHRRYARPIAWMLNGEMERAREILIGSLQDLGDQSDAGSEYFRVFGNAFTDYIDG